MPVTYSIDTSLRVVHTTWVGAVTMEEALAHNDALRVDPNFEPDMRQLSDARLTTSTVSAEGIRRLAGESPFGQGSVRAILVAGDGPDRRVTLTSPPPRVHCAPTEQIHDADYTHCDGSTLTVIPVRLATTGKNGQQSSR